MTDQIDLSPYVDQFPMKGSVRTFHCKSGSRNNSFYLTYMEDSGYVVGYCHHCGGRGRYRVRGDIARQETAEVSRRLDANRKGSCRAGDENSFSNWNLPELSEWNSGEIVRTGFEGLTKDFKRWWLLAGCNVADFDRLGCTYLSQMAVVPMYLDGVVTNLACRTKENSGLPKWVTLGKKQHGFMRTKTSLPNFLVICEDVISAIRLSRYVTALPLLGTSLSDYHRSIIRSWEQEHRNKYQVLVWLDNDLPTVVQKAKKICYDLNNFCEASICLEKIEPKHFINDKDLRDYTWTQI